MKGKSIQSYDNKKDSNNHKVIICSEVRMVAKAVLEESNCHYSWCSNYYRDIKLQ